MQFEKFVGQVQHRAHLPSQGAAMRAICATLETLGERLFGKEADQLAAQLTPALGAYLRLSKEKESFPLDEFLRRVSEREGIHRGDSTYHARVVVEVLREAVSAGEIADIVAQLPADYAPLLESGSQGKMQHP